MYKKIVFIFLTLVIIAFIFNFCEDSYVRKETLSKFGSSGKEVTNIQTKLKNWGYYNGSVDGVYGSKTVAAVKKFQSKNGLRADGIAGSETLSAMGISSSSNSAGSDSNNLNLLARISLLKM